MNNTQVENDPKFQMDPELYIASQLNEINQALQTFQGAIGNTSLDQIPAIQGEPGKPGIGRPGRDGMDGQTPVKGRDYFTEEELNSIKNEVQKKIRIPRDGINGKDGRNGSPDTPQMILDKLHSMPGSLDMSVLKLDMQKFGEAIASSIPASKIKGLPQYYQVAGAGGNSGSVTNVSVVSANGFAGTVATSTTTPAITLTTTITGIIKGNGTAISAAVAGTDYQIPISLTTTGSSGAATFNTGTGVLNIPNYSTGTGTVTSVATGTGLTGGTITSTGTISLSTALQPMATLASNAGKFLRVNAGETAVEYATVSGSGTVTSVAISGGTTGLTVSGSPITISGTITLGGTLGVANGGTGTTTQFTQGSIIYAGASGVYTQKNSILYFDDTNNRIGFGTNTPGSFSGISTVRLEIVDGTGNNSDILQRIAGGGWGAYYMMASQGTAAVPTAISSSGKFGQFDYGGYDGGAYRTGVTILGEVDGTVSSGAMPGRLIFMTSPTGSVTPVERMRISAAGVVTIAQSLKITTPTNTSTSAVTVDATQTLTNKRNTPRTGTTTSSATPTINTDNVDFYSITAQSGNITSMTTNLSGTPTEGQTLWVAMTATSGTPTIAWGTGWEASSLALPSGLTTTRQDFRFVWNTVTSKWRFVGYA